MSRVNEAVAHLREGKARYRVVLDADFCRGVRKNCDLLHERPVLTPPTGDGGKQPPRATIKALVAPLQKRPSDER